MTTTSRSRSRRRQSFLTDILLGSNPTDESRWTQRTGWLADIAQVGCKDGDWTVKCNLSCSGPGTVGWFARFGDEGRPPLAGFIVCSGPPLEYEFEDKIGSLVREWYLSGHLHGWTPQLWVSGSDIEAAGWPATRAPWGSTSVYQFRNGERLDSDCVKLLVSLLCDSSKQHIAAEHRRIAGSDPWWA
jgi:hypothetical protein